MGLNNDIQFHVWPNCFYLRVNHLGRHQATGTMTANLLTATGHFNLPQSFVCCMDELTLTVLVTTIDALQHFETG